MSEKKLAIKLSTLEGIGDAVRSKEGSTEPIPVNVLAERITALPTASGVNKLAQVIDRSITEVTAEDLDGVTTIGDNAFSGCKQIISVFLPEGITGIREYAFYGCTRLKKVTLPISLLYVDSYGFTYESPIEETYYNGEPWQWCKIARKSSATVGDLYLKNELFEHLNFEPTPEAYQGIYKTTYIEPHSFYNCKSIKTVTIKGASNRYSFSSLKYGNSGRSYAFNGCVNLTRVEIGSNQFGGSSSLETSLPSDLFSNCTNLTDIYVCWSEGAIRNAPWGATNATIHYDTPIRFCIDDTEYRGALNMTFAEWVNSEYNTGGFVISEDGYIRNAEGLAVQYKLFNGGNAPVPSNYKITLAYKYLLEV